MTKSWDGLFSVLVLFLAPQHSLDQRLGRVAPGHADGPLQWLPSAQRPLASRLRFHRRAAQKCSSTATRSADDRSPCSRFLAIELMSAETERPRAVASSRSACQNGSSRLMLVLCPDTTTERLGIGEATV